MTTTRRTHSRTFLARRILGEVIDHPGNRSHPATAILRSIGWQARKRAGRADVEIQAYGWRLLLPRSSGSLSNYFYFGEAFEWETVNFVRALARDGDVIVDAGANVGMFTYMAWQCVAPTGQVVALEPIPTFAEVIAANAARNGVQDGVTVLPLAASDAAGEAMFTDDLDVSNHLVGAGPTVSRSGITVPTGRIDAHVAGDPLIVKLDVEGAEFIALSGCEGLVAGPHKPVFIVEANDRSLRSLGSTREAVMDLLRSWGYAFFRYDVAQGTLLPAATGDTADLICVHSDAREFVTGRLREAQGRDVVVTHEAYPAAGTEVEAAWHALAQRAGVGPFQTRAWVEAWRRTLQPQAPLSALVARRDGRVTGILALAQLQRSLHSSVALSLNYVGIAGSGTGAGDHLGPVCESPADGTALIRAAASIASSSTVLLESLAPMWTMPALRAGGRVVATTACPANVRLPSGSFSDNWSRKARKNARRRARQLEDLDVKVRWTSARDDFDAALHQLRALHVEQWQARSQSGLFAEERLHLLRAFAAGSQSPDEPWILLVEVDGLAVAGLLGMVHGTTFSVYKTGWDPAFEHLGLGLVLGSLAMEWAEGRGLTTFDYLRGLGNHKRELGCADVVDTSVIWSRGPRGALLEARERGARRGRPSATDAMAARPSGAAGEGTADGSGA